MKTLMKNCGFVLFSTLLFFSCSNNEENAVTPDYSSKTVEQLLGKNHLNEIRKIASVYSNTLEKAVKKFSMMEPGTVSYKELEEYGNSILVERVYLKSNSHDEYIPSMNLEKLQEYMDDLRVRLESAETCEKEISSEEDLIAFFEDISNKFYGEILHKKSLNDLEKRDIITYAMVASNVILANIAHSDEISLLVDGDITTKGIGSWFKKRWRKIRCGLGIVTTIGGGFLGAVVPPAGAAVAAGGFGLAMSNCK